MTTESQEPQQTQEETDFASMFNAEEGETPSNALASEAGIAAPVSPDTGAAPPAPTESTPAQNDGQQEAPEEGQQEQLSPDEDALLQQIATEGQQVIAENNAELEAAEQQAAQQQQPRQQAQQPPPQQQPQQQPPAPAEVPEEIKNLLQEYPDIAKTVDFVSDIKVKAVEQKFNQALYNAAAVIVDMRRQQAEAAKKINDMEFNQDLLREVPDAYSLVKTKEFREWLPKQRPETQACFTSPDPVKVTKVMQLYKMNEMRMKKQAMDTANQQKVTKIRQQNAASGSRNIARPAMAAGADKNDFLSGFNLGE